MSARAGVSAIASNLNRLITGSSRSLLEQALYPKTSAGNRQLGPVLWGAGYAGGTYLGYPGNYINKNSYIKPKTPKLYMPGYSQYGKRKFSFYKTRYFWKRVYSKKYRKTIYIHPMKRGRYY